MKNEKLFTLEIQKNGSKDYKYYVEFFYYFKYFANGKEYKSSSSISRDDDTTYIEHPYNVGDTFTIYYNKENPEEFRSDINYVSETKLSIIGVILLALFLLFFGKTVIDYKKE